VVSITQSGPQSITVAILPSVTTDIDAGQTLSLTATAENDSTGKGVGWSCSDPASPGAACGTFTNTTTTSATYHAPATVSSATNFLITATSNEDGSRSASVEAMVFPALQISTPSLPPATDNAAYSTVLQAEGGVLPLTWSVSAGSLPGGLALQPSTGVVSGTPTAAGSFGFAVSVKDSSASSGTQSETLTLLVTQGTPLAITTSQLPSASPNTTYSTILQATGGGPTMTWTLISGSLPAGLSLSTNGVISGDPTVPGNYAFVVQVADSASSQSVAASAQAQLSITVVTPLAVGTPVLPPGNQGAAYVEQIAAVGGTPPYTWKLVSGALAPGLVLQSSSGTVSGDPQSAGDFSFTVQVTDSSPTPQTATQALGLTIGTAGPLMITTTALLDAIAGSPYEAMIVAAGGTPPYRWSLADGALPGNLSMNETTGAIAGTPSLTGITSFTVQVTDSSAAPQSQTQALTLAVDNGAEACTSSGNYAALLGSYAFSLSGFNNAGFISVVGSFTADGSGKITGGEADTSGVLGAQHGSILTAASSYSVGSDQLGCATLATPFGTFATHFVLGSFSSNAAAYGRVIEWDSPSPSAYVATGEMFLQNPASFGGGPSGGYVFRTIGWDPSAPGGREVCVGAFNDQSGALSNLEEDCNDAWNIESTAIPDVAGTIGALDANGRGAGILPLGYTNVDVAVYAVTASKFLVIVSDPAPFASGEWEQQTIPAAGFNQDSLNGNMVFYLNGLSLAGAASTASVETATADGLSGLSFNFYEDRAGTMQSTSTLTCQYAVDAIGRVYLSSTVDNCGSGAPVLYLSGANSGLLMDAAPGVDTGAFEPQMAGPFSSNSLDGNFIGGTVEVAGQSVQAELEPVAPNGGGSIAGTTNITSPVEQSVGDSFPATAYTVNSDGTFSFGNPGGPVSGVVISPSKFVMFSPSTLSTSFPTLLVMQQ
jgi:hypothetical protein